MQGHLNKITEKSGIGKNGAPYTMYNIEVDGTWYGCGFNRPNAQEGSFIEFDVVQKGQYKNADNIRAASGAAPVQAQSAAPDSGGSPAPSGPAPVNLRDVSIQYQSSRKDAIATLGVLLAADAIKLPAKAADKFDAAIALVDEMAAQYYIKLENVKSNGGVSVEDAIPLPENG